MNRKMRAQRDENRRERRLPGEKEKKEAADSG